MNFCKALIILIFMATYSKAMTGYSGLWNAIRLTYKSKDYQHGEIFVDKPPPLTHGLTYGTRAQLSETDEANSKCNGIDIRELSIAQIQEHFAMKRLASANLTNCYLQRIHLMNPFLRAIIEVNPDALNEAYLADLERLTQVENRGPLHGIPILLKENVGTDYFMETTAGSLALVGIRPKRDAGVIELLRRAGAVILGKANLSEFAFFKINHLSFRDPYIPSGWSGRGGQTRNPYNLDESPLGSSSCSAVAVAANLAVVSVGTETDGSIISPSTVNGVCGMKPTLGLVPTRGVIPLSHNLDSVGPIARTVSDLAALLDAMVPADAKREVCDGSYSQCLLKENRKNPFRIGVLRYPFWDTDIVNSIYLQEELPLLNEILQNMSNSERFEVLDPVESTPGRLIEIRWSEELIVLLHDFKYGINSYLQNDVNKPRTTPRKITTLKDIIQYNEEHPVPEGYDQHILIMAEATDGLENTTYLKANETIRRVARDVLDSVLLQFKLDAIVVPSEPRINTSLVDSFQDAKMNGWSVATNAGYPTITIPAGIGSDSVPFGIAFIGRPNTESTLLQIAYAVEQITRQRARPQFLE